MASPPQTRCLNCATQLSGAHCHQCGQRATTGRFTWHSLLHDIPHSIFHVDRGIVPTVVGLLRHPGRTINGYLDGRRARYFNPLTLLALLAGLYVLLYSHPQIWEATAKGLPAESRELTLKGTTLATRWYSVSMVLLVPLTAWCNWLAFRGEGRNFAEHLVIMAFISAMATLLMVFPVFPIVLALSLLETAAPAASLAGVWSFGFAATLCYQTIATFAVFNHPGRAWRTWIKASLAASFVFVVSVGTGMLIALSLRLAR